MNNDFSNITQTGIAISMIDLVVSLILSVIIGLIAVLVYRWTHRGLNYERSFLVTLIMIPPIIAVIMMLIGSNLALSLGMVGSLSIIRFRTVIKDSRDMVFLFWTIAIGLGCGTNNLMATLVASGFIATVLAILHAFNYGQKVHSDYVLVVSGSDQNVIGEVKNKIQGHTQTLQLRSMDSNEAGWELVFEIRKLAKTDSSEQVLISELKNIQGVEKVSLLAPQLALPL